MHALRLAWRALLVAALWEWVRGDRRAPFLISENTWPRSCVFDCQRGQQKAVCGSNGRLYESPCAFQRAQCINAQLRPAPLAHCSDPSQSKCHLTRSKALEGGGAIFVPECAADGHFLPVQCHNQTGYCWCSTRDGKPVGGTSVLRLTPNCTEHMDRLAKMADAVSDPIKDDGGAPGPTLDSKKPAELTTPPFLLTILRKSDPRRNGAVRKPTDSPQTCERERASLLAQVRLSWQEERFVPECTADGLYRSVQCHVAMSYCWCVRRDSGRLLPGTSARNRIPDCSAAEEAPADRRHREKPLLGCPGARKKQFLQSLVRALQLEAEHAGSLSLQGTITPPSIYSSTPPTSTSASSPPPPSSPPAAPGTAESSGPEEALRWHFARLDVDSSGELSEREARPLRQFLRRRLKPRRCAKKFAQYCDSDGDRGLTLDELRVCLGL